MAPRSLHVRLDAASAAAFDIVRSGSRSDSDAVRTALHEAARRRRRRHSLAAEAAALAADPADVAEAAEVRALLDELRIDEGLGEGEA